MRKNINPPPHPTTFWKFFEAGKLRNKGLAFATQGETFF